MVAYKEEFLNNSILAEKAEDLYEGNFITFEQLQKIEETLPKLAGSKKIYVRILFFFLGSFLYSSICGMISLLFFATLENEMLWSLAPFIFAFVGIAAMEFVIVQDLKFFQHGIDDAFVLGIILNSAIGFGMENSFEIWIVSAAVFAVAALCYFRYLNIAALIISSLAFIATISIIMIEHIILGSAILPILLAIIAAVSYKVSSKNIEILANPYYSQGLFIIKYFAAILFYISLNYAVITELSAVLMPDIKVNNFSTIMSYLFIIFTAVLPILYIYKGILNKDKPLFLIGLLTVVASYFTLRYYYQPLILEVELILMALILFTTSFFVMKKIKNNLQGVTFLADRLSPNNTAQIELLASISQFSTTATSTQTSPMEFGGGGFSGGGAGENF